MAKLPGKVGWPLLSDKSYEFYKDPIKFLKKYMEDSDSYIFAVRFLNKPTVFVGSNTGVAQVLADKVHLRFGYKEYMEEIFGQNIIFTDGEMAEELREPLRQLFSEESLIYYQAIVDSILATTMNNLDNRRPIPLYSFFKHLVTEICLSVFLGLNFQEANTIADTIIAWTTTHWHGIISIPVSVKFPGTDTASTYSKALEAKKKLLDVIIKKRQAHNKMFCKKMEKAMSMNEDRINHHLLLFTSALVPKALASLLTSMAIEISKEENMYLQSELLLNSDVFENTYLEVQRLYPPFIAGRRVAEKDITVDGYKIPKGHAVVLVTHSAHRDASVFYNSEEFYPDRWKDCPSVSKSKLFCFGGGTRSCVGQKFVDNIIKTVMVTLLSKFRLHLLPNQNLEYKWLPVSRPKEEVYCAFQRKENIQ